MVNQTGALQGRGFIDIHKIDKVRKSPRHSVAKLQIFYWNRDEPTRFDMEVRVEAHKGRLWTLTKSPVGELSREIW